LSRRTSCRRPEPGSRWGICRPCIGCRLASRRRIAFRLPPGVVLKTGPQPPPWPCTPQPPPNAVPYRGPHWYPAPAPDRAVAIRGVEAVHCRECHSWNNCGCLRGQGDSGRRSSKGAGDKVMRMYAVTSTVENGLVHIPEQAEWLSPYLHELIVFCQREI
jgi:hypothetical protein